MTLGMYGMTLYVSHLAILHTLASKFNQNKLKNISTARLHEWKKHTKLLK